MYGVCCNYKSVSMLDACPAPAPRQNTIYSEAGKSMRSAGPDKVST